MNTEGELGLKPNSHFSQYSDQRLYMFEESCDLVPLTPETEEGKSARYADGRITENGNGTMRKRTTRPIKRSHQMRLLPSQRTALNK